MLKYIFKRLMAGVLTIIVLITVAFFMMHAMPGSPFTQSEQRDIPPEVLERMIASYGLDRPVFEQYLSYWNSLLHGDLGLSYKQANTSVNDIIETHFPVSARVGAVAVIVSLLIGIPLGLLAAVYRGRAIDMASMAFATIGISIPVFVISVLLMYLFANVLQWLPSYGLTSWRHYILPVACLSFNPIAYIARQTRSSMLDALEQDYVRTARAQGRQRTAGRDQARAEERADAGHHLSRPAGGRTADRFVRGGAPVLRPGHRPLLRAVRLRPRLHDDHGHRHLLRHLRRHLQPGLRHPAGDRRPARQAERILTLGRKKPWH